MKKALIALSMIGLLAGCSANDKTTDEAAKNKLLENVKEEQKSTETVEKKEGVSLEEQVKENTEAQQQEQKTAEQMKKEINRLEKLDFEKITSDSLKKAKSFPNTDTALRKWIIRLDMYSVIQNTKLSDDQLLKEAKNALAKRNAWFEYVQKEYKVSITNKEVDDYIKQVAAPNENTKAIAKGLGMSVDYMNSTYDRDQYELQVYWQKILPQLEKKYPVKENETLADYNNRLNNEFEKELDAYLKK